MDGEGGGRKGTHVGLLLGVLDVGVDQQGVHLGVDVLDGDLEAVEAAGLGDLDLRGDGEGEGGGVGGSGGDLGGHTGGTTTARTSLEKLRARFSLTMPSEAAKKARTREMK
jgi:hypothetical protein